MKIKTTYTALYTQSDLYIYTHTHKRKTSMNMVVTKADINKRAD